MNHSERIRDQGFTVIERVLPDVTDTVIARRAKQPASSPNF